MEIVKLNVGGRVFTTERDTLLAATKPGEMTFFDGLLSCQSTILKVVDDRDPDLFEHILRWLRERKHKRHALLPVNDLQLLRSEADFYLLSELVEEIDRRLAAQQAAGARTFIGALLVGATAVGAAIYLSRKPATTGIADPTVGGPDPSHFRVPQVSGDDLALCLLDEFSLMKAQSLS